MGSRVLLTYGVECQLRHILLGYWIIAGFAHALYEYAE